MDITTVPFDKFMSLPNALYKSMGVTSYDKTKEKQPRSYLLDLVFVVNILNLNLVLVLEIMFVMTSFKNNTKIEEALLNLSFIGFVSVCDIKVWSIWRKKAQLTALIRDLQELFPKTAKEQEKYRVQEILLDYSRVTVPFVMLGYILVWCYNLLALLTYFVIELWLQLRVVGYVLPYHIYVPWDYSKDWTYFVLYTIENLAGHTTMAGQLGTDSMLFVVATQVIMHYQYLSNHIESYEAGATGAYEKDMEFLKRALEYHQKVLRLSEAMNDIFGVSLLFNFISSSLVICFLGFQMTIDIKKDLMVIVIFFLLCNLVQLFYISRFGHELIVASEGIGHAVYNHNWHNADIRYRKMLVVFIQRAQKTSILKATTFLDVSLIAMSDFMQLSYKFFALLRTMYSE